ncbi:hypothetical protein PHISP_07344 [Aspergillus sp. HF37]|nr:hypothetical protein PHISP_07344 [Aspergillus sp. HF37]
MDLSSLEGPPIHDPRFTITPNHNIPRCPDPVRSQHRHDQSPGRLLLHPTPPPARPRSADSPRRHQTQNTEANTNTNTRPRLGLITPRVTRPRSLDSRDNGSWQRNLCLPVNRNRPPYNHFRDRTTTAPSPPPNRHTVLPRAQLQPQPHHHDPSRTRDTLVWLEDQQVWITAGSPSHDPGPQNLLHPYPYPHAQYQSQSQSQFQPRPRSLSDSHPAPTNTTTNTNALIEDDDLPPSYESHYFDRVVCADGGAVQVVVVPQAGPVAGDTGGISRGVGYGGVPDTRDSSRWTAVGGRVNRHFEAEWLSASPATRDEYIARVKVLDEVLDAEECTGVLSEEAYPSVIASAGQRTPADDKIKLDACVSRDYRGVIIEAQARRYSQEQIKTKNEVTATLKEAEAELRLGELLGVGTAEGLEDRQNGTEERLVARGLEVNRNRQSPSRWLGLMPR